MLNYRKKRIIFLFIIAIVFAGCFGFTYQAKAAMSDFNKVKKLDVTSATDTPTTSRAVPIKITSGNDSTTGTGEIELDWTNISSESDIAIYDENDNLLDYYIEEFDSASSTATIHVYRDWVRDDTTQAQIAYGDGSSDQSVSADTVFDNENDLEGGWLLNEDSGDALDVTSNNNDGAVHSATQGQDGIVGGAYDFDGDDDYVDMPGLQTFSEYTASLWLKLDQIQSNWNIVFDTWEDAGGDHQASIESGDEGDSTLTVKTVDGSVDLADFSNYTGDWTHITVTYDGSQWVTYVNGSQQNSLDGTSDPDLSGGFRLMGRDGSDYEVDGMSDDVHVHTSALSSDEITAIYDAKKSSPDFFSQQAGEDTTEEETTEYETAGTSTSVNLLSEVSLRKIESFYHNASSVPSETSIKFRYSTSSDSGPWFNSNGTAGEWDEYTSAGSATTSLTGLNLNSVDDFYYQVRFESNGSSTPELDEIKLEYSNTQPASPSNPSPSDNSTDVSVSPELAVDVKDLNENDLTVSFYDASNDSLIGTTTVTDTDTTTTASTTWSGLETDNTYYWYAVADDGEDSSTSSSWRFTTREGPEPPVSLAQYKGDCSTEISVGDWISDTNSICFEAQISAPESYDVKLQLDYAKKDFGLNSIDATSSSWCSATCTPSIVKSLDWGEDYRWRARTVDSEGGASNWVEFNSGKMAFGLSKYYQAGTSTSVNLLEGTGAERIHSFYYDLATLPGDGNLKFRFATSSNSGPWYNSEGTEGGWDKANTTGGGTILLSDLGWSGPNFYYQAKFEATSEGLEGPVLDLIGLEYNVESVDIKGTPELKNIEIGF